MKILIISNAFYNKDAIAGGDVIFSEYVKKWSKLNVECEIWTNENGFEFCRDVGVLDNSKNNFVKVKIIKSCSLDFLGVYVANIYRTLASLIYSLKADFSDFDYIFSASDFLPDVIPAYLSNLKWISSLYIISPSPFRAQFKGNRLRAIFSYGGQKLSILLLKKKADLIFTSSPKYIKPFSELFGISENNILAIRGGIDIEAISNATSTFEQYEAVFMGRLHPQKNPQELLEIWRLVVNKFPNLKLAIIGKGSEEKSVLKIISQLSLEKNVTLLGAICGNSRYDLLKSAKIFISASHSDSGNICLDEALACGLPGIVYDLPLIVYPQGVVKVKTGDKEKFAEEIINMLTNTKIFNQFRNDGKFFAESLDWNILAKRSLEFMNKYP